MIGIPRIDEHVIDDHFRAAHTLPDLAQIGRLPEALGGSGVHDLFVGRILLEHAGAARGKRDALNLRKQVACRFALVNSRAGAGENDRRIVMIDDDRKHVGVVNHALINMLPVGAGVGSFPGQVPGSGIDGVRIFGIHRNRLDILDVDGVRGRQALPGIAAILAAEDAIERARDEHVGIALVHGHGAD